MKYFRSGATNPTKAAMGATTEALVKPRSAVTIKTGAPQHNSVDEAQLELERIRLAHELKLKQLDQAERQEQREHERRMLEHSQTQQDDIMIERLKVLENRLEQKPSESNAFSLTDFPKPYQKQFKELAKAILQAHDEPYSFEDYDNWLEAYHPFKGAVEKLIAKKQPSQPLCNSLSKVLKEVEPLVQELRDDLYRESTRWVKAKSTLSLPKDMRRLIRTLI